MSISETLDQAINALPENHKKSRTGFSLDRKQYETLCEELKRKAVKYKGYRLLIIDDDKD